MSRLLPKQKDMLNYKEVRQEDMEYLFPELVESDDKRIIKELIKFITDKVEQGSVNAEQFVKHKSWIAWLEKQGEQKPTAWSEEDEAVLDALIQRLEGEDIHVSQHLAVKCLKSLKDRMQPKLEWSEEDGRCIRYLIECLEVCVKGTAIKMLPSTAQKYIEWLKSLRPQNTWKPSDEQMLSLERASNSLVSKEDTLILRKLLEQLKKLKG